MTSLSGFLRIVALTVAGVLLAVAPAAAQRPLASLDAQRGVDANPYTSEEDVAVGGELFASRCVTCHGADGRGDRGPDLTREVFRHGNSDRAIFMNILSGIPNTGMPSVRLSDKEMWQIVAFVRSLRAPAEMAETGDPDAGRELYARHDCGRCHFVNGEGGRLGPELSTIGWSRPPVHLRASLVDPGGDIEDDYRQVRVAGAGGAPTVGVLLNEDAYSIQLLDIAGRLRSFMKSDVEELERPQVSLMPSFAGRLDDTELDDLVAYLSSLRRR